MLHPSHLGWQLDWPVFIKKPFDSHGRTLKAGEHFNWRGLNVSEEAVARLYSIGMVYHNKTLEKETKVGDRLEELQGPKLELLVSRMNHEVKSRTNSTTEFTSKRCKQSKIDPKQRGMIRSFLRNNRWIEDLFFEIRDDILNKE